MAEERTEFRYIYLRGRSMLPVLRDGDLLRASWTRIDSVGKGDIIALEKRDGIGHIVHRTTRIADGGNGRFLVFTAGDNSGPDPPRIVRDSVLVIRGVLREGVWRSQRNSFPLRLLYLCRRMSILQRLYRHFLRLTPY